MPEQADRDRSEELVEILGPRSRPDPGWVAAVVGCPRAHAEKAIASITKHKALVTDMYRRISSTGRGYYAQFPAPIELYAMTRLVKPKTLVESGVASGVSTTFLLLGLAANRTGALHSIDFPSVRTGRKGDESWAIPRGLTSGWAIPPALKRRWTIRLGRSEDLLHPLLRELGTLDLYCHDSPVSAHHLAFEMKAIGAYLKPGSLVVADNTDANREAFESAARRAGTHAEYRRKSSLAAFRVPLAS